MCKKCDAGWSAMLGGRRRRLWEIEPTWHCSIIGTCLTLGDLRKLARKFGVKPPEDPLADFDSYLHGSFVKTCAEPSQATKMMEKILNKRHASAVKRFHAIPDMDALAEAWFAAFKAGDIAGPYWALLSHPGLDPRLGARAYNDIHMLSHLVGSSNRAALASLRQLESDLAEAQEHADTARTRAFEKLEGRDQRIAELEKQVALLTGKLDRARAQASAQVRPAGPAHEQEDAFPRRDEKLRELSARNEQLEAETRDLKALCATLRDEVRILENTLQENADWPAVDASTDWDAPADTGAPADTDTLRGATLLFVGGRTRMVGRLATLVRRYGAELNHHDGGLEQSLEELGSLIHRSDAVFFPTDCISHSAMHRVKELCKSMNIPWIPLRTGGVASFAAGLNQFAVKGHDATAATAIAGMGTGRASAQHAAGNIR